MKKINPKNWFCFRKRASKVHPFILDLMYYYSTTSLSTKVYGAPSIEQIDILEGDWANASVRVSHIDNFGRSIIKKIHRNSQFTPSLISKSKKCSQRMVKDLKELKKLVKFSDKKVFEIYSRLVKDYRLFCLFSFPIWILGEKLFPKKQKKF